MEDSSALTLLTDGVLEPEGRIAWGSNYTLLARIFTDDEEGIAIYKPQQGERPLWDFPSGTLCKRERAAYLLSQFLGWDLVPPTVLREGPVGWGSVQTFIEHDPDIHYFNFQSVSEHDEQLQQIVLFDLVSNNADRKAGHVLCDNEKRLWAIDHGLCFHCEYKLRSVIWDFANRPIPPQQLAALQRVNETLGELTELTELISPDEIHALKLRLQSLIDMGVFPEPGMGRHYPWPPV